MTTNQTMENITSVLEKMQTKDPNIKITSTINTSVAFLDVTITNEDGCLRTTIFHKPTTEPYILPYTSDHPTHVCRNIPYAALLRAARICSHVEDFNNERIRIDMSLLLNHYPPNFITKHFNRFFALNNAIPVFHEINPRVYNELHESLLHQSTRREKQLSKMIQDPIRYPTVLQPKIWNSQILYPRYKFDSSLSKHFQSKFQIWWKTYYGFHASPIENIQVKMVADTNPTLEQNFIQKKPSKLLLTITQI